MIAALFVETNGVYFGLPDVDPWDVHRDARLYAGPHAVIAHPPCYLWVNLAAVNWKRYQRERPAWYPGGDDGGCFASALASIRRWGGVLEHPAQSHAWDQHSLIRPFGPGWQPQYYRGFDGEPHLGWSCEVWQSAYGHQARKRTWLYVVGPRPPEMIWDRRPGTHQCGWFDRIKPTLSKANASRTPPAFAEALIGLANHVSLRRAA